MDMLKKIPHPLLVCSLILLTLLLFHNPYSKRTLVPNFEPYPDALHYVVPARSYINGDGFLISREGRGIKPSVPPLYSYLLIPFFLVNNDPRTFYFTNVLLSLCSLVFFYLILRRISKNYLIIGLSLLLYATNYFIYWYPTLAMAENLTLFLFLLNAWLLTIPLINPVIVFGAVVPFLFYLTKYANGPLTAVFLLATLVRIIFSKKDKNQRHKVIFLASLIFGALILYVTTPNIITAITSVVRSIMPISQFGHNTTASSGTGGWFSMAYMTKNLPEYARAMLGGYSVRFLWDSTPIIPFFVGLPALAGLIWGSIRKDTRLLSLSVLCALVASILFMSTFYSLDMRYLNFAIPTLLLGFTIFLDTLGTLVHKKKQYRTIFTVGIVLVILAYMGTNAIRMKKQIMLNLKYAETPWYYLSVLKANEYFGKLPKTDKMPVLISSMIPYYIDFYSNGEYSLLPMSHHQEFRNNMRAAWGDFNYDDLIMLYKKTMYRGYDLYVDNYGLGNEAVLHEDFKKIADAFNLEKVAEGCYGACNIYKLHPKEAFFFKLNFVVE